EDYFSGFVDRLREEGIFRVATFPMTVGLTVGSPAWQAEQSRIATQTKSFRPHEILLVATGVDVNDVLIESISELPASVSVAPPSIINLLPSGEIVDFGAGPAIRVSRAPLSAIDRAAKRCIDVAGAVVAIIVLSPLLAVVALAVKLTSPG